MSVVSCDLDQKAKLLNPFQFQHWSPLRPKRNAPLEHISGLSSKFNSYKGSLSSGPVMSFMAGEIH